MGESQSFHDGETRCVPGLYEQVITLANNCEQFTQRTNGSRRGCLFKSGLSYEKIKHNLARIVNIAWEDT